VHELFLLRNIIMKKTSLIASAAVMGILTSGNAVAAMPKTDANTEKCYGIAKAGQNACASANGSHGCARLAKKDNDPNEWKVVAAGTCNALGGNNMPTPGDSYDTKATAPTEEKSW
jgi:uncharacterized membrane protein